MASSKLMSSINSDLITRKSSTNSSSSINNKNSNTFQMSDNQLPQSQPLQTTLLDAAAVSRQDSVPTSSKSVDDVWKELVAGRSCKQEVPDEMMTLEDFLAKAGAVEEEDVKIPPQRLPSGGIFSFDNPNSSIHPPNVNVDGFGIGGKKRAMLKTLDKAAQQRQRRMIKNRESAARSRERKQAYQAELESLAVKLEEENEALLKVKTEQTRIRYKQLMDSIIPVTEKQRPRRNVLRRVRSMEW
ncbi:G-box-binding factor 4-like [Bidens hawaiensis]|uniref:G-box-binding factor 4-like n=1 Tax=Bidens hawaiensis TaxID=980011 RepID=UPI0040490CAA